MVLGATGKTGRLAVRELTRRGHGVTAVVRNKKTLADLLHDYEAEVGQRLKSHHVEVHYFNQL